MRSYESTSTSQARPPRQEHPALPSSEGGLLSCSWPSQHQTILQILPVAINCLINWGQWASGGARRDFSGLPTILLQPWLRLVLGTQLQLCQLPRTHPPPAAGDSPRFPLTHYLLQTGAMMGSNKSEQRSQWLEKESWAACNGPQSMSHTENFVNEMGRDWEWKEMPKNGVRSAAEQKWRPGTVSSCYTFQFCDWKSLKSIMQWILKPRKWERSSPSEKAHSYCAFPS